MLSRLVGSATPTAKGTLSTPASEKSVSQLLAELAQVRARKAELDREETEILAATRESLRRQQAALEELKKKVQESGIEVDGVTAVSPSQSSTHQPEPAELPVV